MNEIVDFFSKLFDTSDWPPRWHCGTWSDFHGWLYIISDLGIWAAYFAIPIAILKYMSKKRLDRFLPLYFLFAAFILACGTTHFLDAVTFWHPLYRLNALVKAITAIVSITTAFYLIRLLPYAFELKSPKLLEAEIEMRIKAEAALKHKNELMAEAEIIGNFGSFEWDIKAGELHLSNGMQHLIERNEVAVMKYTDFVEMLPNEEKATEAHLLDLLLFSKKYKSRYHHITTPKGERIFFTRGKEVLNQNGEVEKVIGTTHDITDIEKNKELLEESRQTFKNAFDHSSIGFAIVSTEGRCIDANLAISNILGYSKEEIQQLNFQEITFEEDLQADLEQVNKMLRNEIKTYRMEKRYKRKDGSITWALLSVSLIWKNNRPSFFVAQIIDISLQKKLLNEFVLKNNELTVANKALEYHIAQVDEFNRIIAHNLRGPASTLINLAEYLQVSDNEEDKTFLLSKVKNTAEAIIVTLDDLKQFIEIHLNKEETFTPSSFKVALDKSLKLLHEKVESTKAVITTDFKCETVKFPAAYLESTFYNLISNSIKYSAPSTVPVIHIQTRVENKNVLMTLHDNGIGINLNKHKDEVFKYKKIFHKGYESNGLGLFLTRNHLEAYGAQIEINSEVNKGTAFHITFTV